MDRHVIDVILDWSRNHDAATLVINIPVLTAFISTVVSVPRWDRTAWEVERMKRR